MHFTIRLFAGLADKIGHSQITITVEPHELELQGVNAAQMNCSTITVAQLKQLVCNAYPHATNIITLSFIAKNQNYALADEIVLETDELALIPPVSGGEPQKLLPIEKTTHSISRYSITYEPISIERLNQLVSTAQHGANLTFIGTTREFTDNKRTVWLEYDAYIPMALQKLVQIGTEIDERWPGTLTAITHRLGKVALGEASVVIAVSSPHRNPCYEASRYAIERLKHMVPIWKKEIWEDGSVWKGQPEHWDPRN